MTEPTQPEPLFTKDELELRLTKSVFRRVFNDNDTGEPDEPAELQLRQEASSKVRGALSNTYDIEALSAENVEFATELRRLGLDVGQAMCAQRSPGIVPVDGFALMKQANDELKELREAKISLVSAPDDGSGTPTPTSDTVDNTPDEATITEVRALPGLGNFYG